LPRGLGKQASSHRVEHSNKKHQELQPRLTVQHKVDESARLRFGLSTLDATLGSGKSHPLNYGPFLRHTSCSLLVESSKQRKIAAQQGPELGSPWSLVVQRRGPAYVVVIALQQPRHCFHAQLQLTAPQQHVERAAHTTPHSQQISQETHGSSSQRNRVH
jgi:hypothetical protein